MSTIIEQIKSEIEKAAAQHREKHGDAVMAIIQRNGYRDGAYSIIPLLEKVLEQRDETIVNFYDGRAPEYVFEPFDKELLELLEK